MSPFASYSSLNTFSLAATFSSSVNNNNLMVWENFSWASRSRDFSSVVENLIVLMKNLFSFSPTLCMMDFSRPIRARIRGPKISKTGRSEHSSNSRRGQKKGKTGGTFAISPSLRKPGSSLSQICGGNAQPNSDACYNAE